MTMFRSVWRSVPLATVVLASAAPMVSAQWGRQTNPSRMLFEWTGSVDREKQIVMRNGRVYTNDIGRTEPRMERTRTVSSMPRESGRVVVRILDGRGDVDVIEQPSPRNNYSTVIRVVDPRSGSDTYRLAAYWEDYGYSNRGGMNSRGRDDDWDRGRGPNDGYGRQDVLHWSGNVDDELEIRLQNGRVQYRTIRGAQPTSIRSATGNANLSRNDQVSVSRTSGRGSVTIVQQPSSFNGFTTVIRVKDPQGGYGHYDFDIVAH